MSETPQPTIQAGTPGTLTPDPRWQDLYRIGYFTSLALVVTITLAVVAFFVFPYSPGVATLSEIFATLQTDRLAGLLSLDFPVMVVMPLMLLNMVALYVTLKGRNESLALVALVLGVLSIGLYLTARPLVEMVYLSDRYVMAVTAEAKNQYLFAGEAVHTLFNGTAWMLALVMLSISSLTSSMLMLRSGYFSRITAYAGIINAVIGLGFWLPGIGLFLNFLGTVGSIVWYSVMARDFHRLGWGAFPVSQPARAQARSTR